MHLPWHLGTTALSLLGLLADCSPAPAPSPARPGGALSLVQGTTNVTTFPSVHIDTSSSFQLDSWAAETNGSVATAGNTLVLSAADGLEILSSTQAPAPLLQATLPPSTTTAAARGAAFGGAACISFSFSTNSTSAQVALADFNAFTDPNYKPFPPVLSSSFCNATNCTTIRSVALNTSGRYYFVMLNPGPSWARLAVSYTLRGLGDPVCQNLQQMPLAAYPAPLPTNMITLAYPALLKSLYVDSSGIFAPIGSFLNTSCFNAKLLSTPTNSSFKPMTNASLILLDTFGFEAVLNGTAINSLPAEGRCNAGTTASQCDLVAGSLDPLEQYFLLLLYPGEPNTTLSTAIRAAIRVDAAFSAFDAGLASHISSCNMVGVAPAPSTGLGPSKTPGAPLAAPALAPSNAVSRP